LGEFVDILLDLDPGSNYPSVTIRIQKESPMTPITQEPEAPVEEPPDRQPRWELAECACPDWCERDHEND
jgi:hypothetical protein